LVFGYVTGARSRVTCDMRDSRLVPYRLRLKKPARELRRDPTPAERKLWYEFLRYLPHKFTRQKPLGSFIADFFCSRLRMVIEIDGDSHFSADGQHYDARRSQILAALGLRVIRFTNAEVMGAFEGVCQRIEDALTEKR
jgi:very-short-patch-repair endonuclease